VNKIKIKKKKTTVSIIVWDMWKQLSMDFEERGSKSLRMNLLLLMPPVEEFCHSEIPSLLCTETVT
jgi:hypothetical protein